MSGLSESSRPICFEEFDTSICEKWLNILENLNYIKCSAEQEQLYAKEFLKIGQEMMKQQLFYFTTVAVLNSSPKQVWAVTPSSERPTKQKRICPRALWPPSA